MVVNLAHPDCGLLSLSVCFSGRKGNMGGGGLCTAVVLLHALCGRREREKRGMREH